MANRTADELIQEELQRMSGVTAGHRAAAGSKRGARRRSRVAFDLPWNKKQAPDDATHDTPAPTRSVVTHDADGTQETRVATVHDQKKGAEEEN